MSLGYRVANLRLQSGERLPLLLNSDTGAPLWGPALFVITQLRASNLAARTLQQATRAIMFGLQALNHLGIDLEYRLTRGGLLTLDELDALSDLLGLSQEALDQLTQKPSIPSSIKRRPVSLERARMRTKSNDQPSVVAPGTKGIRLLYLRDYIKWLTSRRLLSLDHRDPIRRALSDALNQFVERIDARMPVRMAQDDSHAREGLDLDMQRRILEVIDPNSPENPWKNQHVRLRNQLIFMWLLGLGLRRGELLGVKLSDIDLRSCHVQIVRRADDPEETRRDEPAVKTRGRLLAIDRDLAELTRAYVHGPRRSIKEARRHPFLLVATGTGAPLTTSGLSKLFIELRSKVPGLPDELSPHVLRHTWNERFSELMDSRGVAPEEEEKLRKQQMGWSDRSKMSAVYTRRHVRIKATEASLEHQAKSFLPIKSKK